MGLNQILNQAQLLNLKPYQSPHELHFWGDEYCFDLHYFRAHVALSVDNYLIAAWVVHIYLTYMHITIMKVG